MLNEVLQSLLTSLLISQKERYVLKHHALIIAFFHFIVQLDTLLNRMIDNLNFVVVYSADVLVVTAFHSLTVLIPTEEVSSLDLGRNAV